MKRLFTRVSHLSPGVVDSGLASLATFAAGLTGVRLLGDVDRGVYGVFFTAFILGGVIVSQLIYVPAQVAAIAEAIPDRLNGFRKSVRLGILPSLAGSLAAGLAAALTYDLTSSAIVMALTATTGTTIVVSALQDHVRRLLHIAEKSWHAVAVSGVQLLSIAISIAVLLATDINRAWVPFGSLLIANTASTAAGIVLANGHRRPKQSADLTFTSLAASGKWLVARAAIPSAAAFVAANMLTRLAGPEAYGYAESARQVAQPVTVLALGLSAILGPRAVRAGMDTDTSSAKRTRKEFVVAIGAVALVYGAITAVDWPLNPMAYIVPSAYEVSWVVPLTVLANAIAAVVMLTTSEVLGAGKARLLAKLALISSPMLIIVAAASSTLGANARPIEYVFEGLIVLYGARRWLVSHYATGATIETGQATRRGRL